MIVFSSFWFLSYYFFITWTGTFIKKVVGFIYNGHTVFVNSWYCALQFIAKLLKVCNNLQIPSNYATALDSISNNVTLIVEY